MFQNAAQCPVWVDGPSFGEANPRLSWCPHPRLPYSRHRWLPKPLVHVETSMAGTPHTDSGTFHENLAPSQRLLGQKLECIGRHGCWSSQLPYRSQQRADDTNASDVGTQDILWLTQTCHHDLPTGVWPSWSTYISCLGSQKPYLHMWHESSLNWRMRALTSV